MKKVFLIVLTVFVVLGFTACDESGEKFYVKFVHNGTSYNLVQGDVDIDEAYLSIDYGLGFGDEPFDELYIYATNEDDSCEFSLQITTDIYDAFTEGGSIDEAIVRVPTGPSSWENYGVDSYEITNLALTNDEVGEVTGVAEGTFVSADVTEGKFRVKVVDIANPPVK